MNENLNTVVDFAADLYKKIKGMLADGKVSTGEILGLLGNLLPASGIWDNREAIAGEWKNRTPESLRALANTIDARLTFLETDDREKVKAIIDVAVAGLVAFDAFKKPEAIAA